MILADLAGGASNARDWFEDAADYALNLNIEFTAVGVTPNEARSIQSVLKWAEHLDRKVDYLVVLNEMRSPRCDFHYWKGNDIVADFLSTMEPYVMTMKSRLEDFQAEIRNHACTLDAIIKGEVDSKFFRYTSNIVRAKIYQSQLYKGFDEAAAILLPTLGSGVETTEPQS